jgi:hypothetical protein
MSVSRPITQHFVQAIQKHQNKCLISGNCGFNRYSTCSQTFLMLIWDIMSLTLGTIVAPAKSNIIKDAYFRRVGPRAKEPTILTMEPFTLHAHLGLSRCSGLSHVKRVNQSLRVSAIICIYLCIAKSIIPCVLCGGL